MSKLYNTWTYNWLWLIYVNLAVSKYTIPTEDWHYHLHLTNTYQRQNCHYQLDNYNRWLTSSFQEYWASPKWSRIRDISQNKLSKLCSTWTFNWLSLVRVNLAVTEYIITTEDWHHHFRSPEHHLNYHIVPRKQKMLYETTFLIISVSITKRLSRVGSEFGILQ